MKNLHWKTESWHPGVIKALRTAAQLSVEQELPLIPSWPTYAAQWSLFQASVENCSEISWGLFLLLFCSFWVSTVLPFVLTNDMISSLLSSSDREVQPPPWHRYEINLPSWADMMYWLNKWSVSRVSGLLTFSRPQFCETLWTGNSRWPSPSSACSPLTQSAHSAFSSVLKSLLLSSGEPGSKTHNTTLRGAFYYKRNKE